MEWAKAPATSREFAAAESSKRRCRCGWILAYCLAVVGAEREMVVAIRRRQACLDQLDSQ